jgi:effector-binding domain-containing protein
MLSEHQIVQTTAEQAAVIRLTIPGSDMPKVFGPAVGELLTTLNAQGIEPVGAIFAHHLKMPSNVFDFELGIKVGSPVTPAGRVEPGELPATRVARAIYTGPYEGLPAAWDAFIGWMNANGHKGAPSLWELYSVGPQSTPDSAEWRTELNRPLLD